MSTIFDQFHFLAIIWYDITVYGHNQPSLQFENNEFVVGLGDELNAELKNTVQICDERSVLGKILANICIF